MGIERDIEQRAVGLKRLSEAQPTPSPELEEAIARIEQQVSFSERREMKAADGSASVQCSSADLRLLIEAVRG